MERPQVLQGWSSSSIGGKFRQRIRQILRFEQPWKLNNHGGDVQQGNHKWDGGLPLGDATNVRRARGLTQILGLLIRTWLSLLSLIRCLLPRRGVPIRQKKGNEIHPLAYLDGLRAYGSLIIFTGHTMSRRWKWCPEFIFNTPWLSFPFRTIHVSLDIFFFISGYALTWRMIGYMQTRKYDKLMDTLTSSVFKRYFRLFLPVIVMNTFTVLLIPIGVVVLPTHLQKKLGESGGNLFKWWLADLVTALNPWSHTATYWHKDAAGSHFLEQFWSINTEFRQSMMLFCFCAATCKMTSAKRKGLMGACGFFCLAYQVQTATMAFFGMWLAECKQQRLLELAARKRMDPSKQQQTSTADVAMSSAPTSDEKPHAQDPETMVVPPLSSARQTLPELLQRLHKPFLVFMFIYSFVVFRDPHEAWQWKTFPHSFINDYLTPSHWVGPMKMHLHLIVGVMMMLYPLDQLPMLQRPLVAPFSQYLGELSFGIYGVHLTVRYIVWEPRLLKWWRGYYGTDVVDRFPLLWPAYLIMLLCVLWAAEVFRRMDMQIVKILQKLETWAFKQ